MSTKKQIKKRIYFVLRLINRIKAHLLALSFRKKLIIMTLLSVSASFYSAPVGMILLSAGLIYEWRKSPERKLPFGYLARNSVFLIPGTVMLLSAITGPIYFKHYASAGLALLVLAPVLFCAVAIEVLWQKEDALHFARYATILMLPLSILAFAFPWSGGSFPDYFQDLRVAATFSNPNYFAYILEMVLLFAIALYYHIWKQSSRAWLLVSTILSMACLYFTGSRMGMLAFFTGLTVFYLCMSEKRFLGVVFGSITIFLVATALFPEGMVLVFRDLIPRPENFIFQINNRFLLWDVALRQIASNPILGTGIDTYRLLIPKDAPWVLQSSMHSHNIYINLWLETGLFGISAFLWMVLRAGSTAIRRLKNSPVRPYLSAGIGMIAVTAVHGITDAPLVSSQSLSLFGLFLACLVVMNRKTMRF